MNIGMNKPFFKKDAQIGDKEEMNESEILDDDNNKIERVKSSKNHISSTATKEKVKTNNSSIKNSVKELEKYLGINTSPKNLPLYFLLGGWLCVISSSKPTIIVGLVLATIAVILSFSKNYKDAFKWNKAITLYVNNDIEKSKTYLDKLSTSEKEGEAYKKMLELLNHKE